MSHTHLILHVSAYAPAMALVTNPDQIRGRPARLKMKMPTFILEKISIINLSSSTGTPWSIYQGPA